LSKLIVEPVLQRSNTLIDVLAGIFAAAARGGLHGADRGVAEQVKQ
jgi:hypothetical protein